MAAANELFYNEGVHTVGINRVIEQAGVAKASLYNTFGSKDELVRAYLQTRQASVTGRITQAVERYDTPRERLLAVFEGQGELFAQGPDYRGCAFARASAESHPGDMVEQGRSGLPRLCRYLGDAHIFNPTLGILLSIAFWLYILGEMYFGRMAEVVRKASRPMQIGYFWIRLIMTVGWAVIPILHFVDVVIGVGYTPVIATLYTIADLVNLIALALTYLAVAGKERY